MSDVNGPSGLQEERECNVVSFRISNRHSACAQICAVPKHWLLYWYINLECRFLCRCIWTGLALFLQSCQLFSFFNLSCCRLGRAISACLQHWHHHWSRERSLVVPSFLARNAQTTIRTLLGMHKSIAITVQPEKMWKEKFTYSIVPP